MDNLAKHPSEFLPLSLVNEIRNEADAAEQIRFLTDRQQQIVFDNRWLNMYVPKSHNGLELSLSKILRVEESLAWVDGSVAWVVTLCSGAAWFVGFLEPTLAEEIFAEKKVCLAGSGAVTGTATKHGDQFIINGYWKYATGSLMATAFTMNCHINENGSPLLDDAGVPIIRSFILRENEVQVHRTWNAMGMVATGSHSFEARNVIVPSSRAFVIHPENATLKSPVFHYPFLQLAETTLAANISGMAVRFLDLCWDIIAERGNESVVKSFKVSQDKLHALRDNFYVCVDHSWSTITLGNAIPDHVLDNVSSSSHALVRGARDVVNNLYPLCGLHAADMSFEINRVWRNFHTAAQHSLFGARASQ